MGLASALRRGFTLPAGVLLTFLVPGCCVEYQPGGQQACPWARTEDTGPPAFDHLRERCDGLDNDLDGQVDEGYPDVDGDGQADCVDGECAIEYAAAEDLEEEHECVVVLVPPEDPWAVEVLWESEFGVGSCREGVIAVDVDGNGTSDVLCAGRDELVAYVGESGEILWTSQALHSHSPLAAADLDGDGAMDIVGLDEEGHVVCLDGAGREQWRGDADIAQWPALAGNVNLEIADLWGRGEPEIVGNYGIASARDGGLVVPLDLTLASAGTSERILAVADLNLDGFQEIIDRAWVYGPDGELEWSVHEPEKVKIALCPMPLQADDDSFGEVVFHVADSLLLAEQDGTVSVEVPLPDLLPTAYKSCAGDVDGDGEMEVVFSDSLALRVFDSRGNQEWATPIRDDTWFYVGCTVFDFDLDGAKEVVFGDGEDFAIFDGRTGEILFQDPSRSSNTMGDSPLVVDLDGDGSVEIVVPSSEAAGWGDSAIRVFTHAHGDWPPGSPIWPSATWSGTSLFLDGSVPRTPEPPWLTTKVWRGQPEFTIPGMDLRPEITDVCVSSCEPQGAVRLAARLVNRGPQEVQRGATLAVYALNEQGERQLLGVREFLDFIDNGWAGTAQEFEVTTEQALAGIILVAGDEGGGSVTIEDCDLANNALEWRLDGCD